MALKPTSDAAGLGGFPVVLPIAVVGILAYQIARGASERAAYLETSRCRRREADGVARPASESCRVVSAGVRPRRCGDRRCGRPHPAIPAGGQAQYRCDAGTVGRQRSRHGDRVYVADAAGPRGRRTRVSAGGPPRRTVGRLSCHAGPDGPGRHADGISPAGQLRSLQVRGRPGGGSRLPKFDARRQFECCRGTGRARLHGAGGSQGVSGAPPSSRRGKAGRTRPRSRLDAIGPITTPAGAAR